MEVREDMAERRTIVAGLKASRKLNKQEKEFVFGKAKTTPKKPRSPKPKVSTTSPMPEKAAIAPPPIIPSVPPPNVSIQPAPIVRVPFSTRISANLANEVKRVTLERQIDGLFPNSLQDIVEAALESWLRSQGRPRP